MKLEEISARLSAFPTSIGGSPLRDGALFLGLTLALTWLFWIPGAYLQSRESMALSNFLLALGSLTPLAVAFYLNRWSGLATFEVVRWLKSLNLRGIVTALLLPFLFLLPILLFRIYNRNFETRDFLGDLRGAITPLVVYLVLAFGEEVGWRGFLLKRLQPFNRILRNLIIGSAWFLWQVPLLIAGSKETFSDELGVRFATYFLFSILITPFFNRLSQYYDFNVLLPSLLRGMTSWVFFVYVMQPPIDFITHPYGFGMVLWLAALNALLFAQLWQGKRSGGESELERVMPLETAG